MCVSARDRELDTLVFADRSTEHFASRGIFAGTIDEPACIADTLGRDQDSLGIHTVENIAETLALFADQVFRRHSQAVEKQFGGGVVQHGFQRPHGQAVTHRFAQVD